MANPLVELAKDIVFPFLKIESTSPKIPHGHEHDKFLRVIRADNSYWHYVLLGWFMYAALWLAGIGIGIIAVLLSAPIAMWIAIPVALFASVKVMVMFVVARIDYELRWYIITDTSITVRQGAWTIREITVSYQNIQNVSVSQGPLERLFGFANLKIDTAGSAGASHGKGGNPNEAILRGIVNAPQIRDNILENLRAFRNSGLGDPDDVAETQTAGTHSRLDILREIAEDMSLLHQAVA